MSEETKPKRKQVEREYIIELLDGTMYTVTTNSLNRAKHSAWKAYPGKVKDVRRSDGKGRKHDSSYPDRTRNDRTQSREADIKSMAERFGYPNKSALLTALLSGENTIVKAEKG